MSLYHIIAAGHEFIGEWDKNIKGIIILKDAVKLLYIHNQQGTAIQMVNLKNDNNYEGKVIITDGPGVIKMSLQELGRLVKTYHKTLSDIKIASPTIIKPNLSKIY